MIESEEYQILIGCHDNHTHSEFVKNFELSDVVSKFFNRFEIDFTIHTMVGGYLYNNGDFAIENGLVIHVIGAPKEQIIRLAKAVSMYMNQEAALVIKNKLEYKII